MVNACLREGRGGSPTAVLWDAELSDTERCQVPALAGASHAVFVQAGGDGATLRFFTATGELPACGHGTVAALAFLAHAGQRAEHRVTLRAGGRTMAGWVTREGGDMRAAFHPGPVALRAATAQERQLALDVIGGAPGGEPCVGSVGRPRLLVALASRQALTALTPDLDRLRRACEALGLLGCYVHTPAQADGRLAARMFAPAIGVPEDVANANGTACLAARLGRGEIRVEMGDALGAPATIIARALDGQVEVGGAARVVGERELG